MVKDDLTEQTVPVGLLSANKFRTALAFFLLAGVIVRLWHWDSQILLNDEWHALNYVTDKTLAELFLSQGMGANSVPVNIYTWLIMKSAGWSDPLIRLPSIIAGISALVVIPLLVARIWGQPVALVCASILSVAPVLIFYTRITRPYAPAMLLASISMLLTVLWIKEGKRSQIIISSISGALAIYYHLYAAITVTLPLFVVAVTAFSSHWKNYRTASATPVTDVAIAAFIMIVMVSSLVVPPTINNPWWMRGHIHELDHANLGTVKNLFTLLTGSDLLLLKSLLLPAAASGFFLITCESKVIGAALTAPLLVYAIIMSLTTQVGSSIAIQSARYGISLFPVIYVAASVAIAGVADRMTGILPCHLSGLPVIVVSVFLSGSILLTGPLRSIYSYPNNFTNHSAYQYRYDPINWETSNSIERDLAPGYSITASEIPEFYKDRLKLQRYAGIIEYPMLIGDHYNLAYFYQHYHRLPVIAGYNTVPPVTKKAPNREWIYAYSMIDEVISNQPVADRLKNKWQSMADLSDLGEIRKKFRGWLLVVHRNPMSEIVRSDLGDIQSSLIVAKLAAIKLGPPVYSDMKIVVWEI